MRDPQKMQALEIKLAKGVGLEKACRQAGVELEKAQEWLIARKDLDDFNRIIDGVWGRASAVEAVEELKNIIKSCPDDETRRRASKDLLEFYRDERKRLELKVKDAQNNAGEGYSQDLFDCPWAFTSGD